MILSFQKLVFRGKKKGGQDRKLRHEDYGTINKKLSIMKPTKHCLKKRIIGKKGMGI
jgi:hypothetical protein